MFVYFKKATPTTSERIALIKALYISVDEIRDMDKHVYVALSREHKPIETIPGANGLLYIKPSEQIGLDLPPVFFKEVARQAFLHAAHLFDNDYKVRPHEVWCENTCLTPFPMFFNLADMVDTLVYDLFRAFNPADIEIDMSNDAHVKLNYKEVCKNPYLYIPGLTKAVDSILDSFTTKQIWSIAAQYQDEYETACKYFGLNQTSNPETQIRRVLELMMELTVPACADYYYEQALKDYYTTR